MAGGLAVALSGGGAKGAFQVGALEQLVLRRGVKIDIAVGTSTGAIQALGVAQDQIAELVRFWMDLKGPDDIYRKRGGPLLAALNGKEGLYDTAPLRRLLGEFADGAALKASGKSLRLTVVNLASGQLISVGENAPNIADWVYASCAMPFAFDPLTSKAADGAIDQWVDGGVRDVTPLDEALKLKPRAVIVIRASAPPAIATRKRYKNLVEIGLRATDILQSEVSLNDLKNVQLINALITARDRQLIELARLGITGSQAHKVTRPLDAEIARYSMARIEVIEPVENLYDTLEFDPAKLREAMDRGRQAVEEAWPRLEPLVGG